MCSYAYWIDYKYIGYYQMSQVCTQHALLRQRIPRKQSMHAGKCRMHTAALPCKENYAWKSVCLHAYRL